MNEWLFRNPSLERCYPEGRACALFPLPLWTKDKAELCEGTKFILARRSVVTWWNGQKSTDHRFLQGRLYMLLPPWQPPGAPNNATSVALMSTDEWPEWPQSTYVARVNPPQEGTWRSGSFLSLCLAKFHLPWVWDSGARHAQPHAAWEEDPGQGGRQLPWWAVVLPACSSHRFTERGCSSRTGLTTEPQRLVLSARVTWNAVPRSPWCTESFSKNAWWASSMPLLSVLFLLEHIQLHRTVRLKP